MAIEGFKHFDSVKLGAVAVHADSLVAITHVKGHEATGFGGATRRGFAVEVFFGLPRTTFTLAAFAALEGLETGLRAFLTAGLGLVFEVLVAARESVERALRTRSFEKLSPAFLALSITSSSGIVRGNARMKADAEPR